MLAPALSGLISGILGYSAATYLNEKPQAPPSPAVEVEMEPPMSLKSSSAPTTSIDIGTGSIITPILQRIKMNDYCNILYSTVNY